MTLRLASEPEWDSMEDAYVSGWRNGLAIEGADVSDAPAMPDPVVDFGSQQQAYARGLWDAERALQVSGSRTPEPEVGSDYRPAPSTPIKWEIPASAAVLGVAIVAAAGILRRR